jgi:hypothetical protein
MLPANTYIEIPKSFPVCKEQLFHDVWKHTRWLAVQAATQLLCMWIMRDVVKATTST